MKTSTPSSTKFFVVCAESGANGWRMCYLGGGSTKHAAILNAYGPSGRLSRGAVVREYESRDEAANEFGDSVYY